MSDSILDHLYSINVENTIKILQLFDEKEKRYSILKKLINFFHEINQPKLEYILTKCFDCSIVFRTQIRQNFAKNSFRQINLLFGKIEKN